MNEPLNNLKRAAAHIRLSHEEKEVMRARIFTAIDARKYEPAPAHFYNAIALRFSWQWVTSFAVLVIFIAGGGTAYAAQDALPGNPLYPVKIYVNEGVAQALATSPEAQIAVHTSIAETRLKEAETLAAQGRLDATTTNALENNLDEHLTQADTIAQSLETQDEGAAVAANVRIESSLAAHSAILERLGEGSKDAATQGNAIRVVARARAWTPPASSQEEQPRVAMLKGTQAQTMSVLSAPDEDTGDASSTTSTGMHVMSALAPASSTTTATTTTNASTTREVPDIGKNVAAQLEAKAQNELAYVKHVFSKAPNSLSATTTAKIQDGLNVLQLRLDTASEQFDEGNYADAQSNFTSVWRDTLELSALVEASKTFNYDFIHASAAVDSNQSDVSHDTQDDSQDTTSGDGGGSLSTPSHVPAHLPLHF